MDTHKYIGTVDYAIIDSNFGTAQWQPKTFYCSPLGTIITLPPMFLSAFGSAGISLSTLSPYSQQYIADVNIVRQDYKLGKPVFDSDRYIVKPENRYGIIFMESPGSQHHLTPHSEFINYFDPQLQTYIKNTLRSH
ncbi:hypothetical protein HY087_01305 [Candidatus Gottesmanbacteria bacterium]|nr:hypothetical protein [Candidatus Gottesmanbacteria bacterium]